MKNWNFGYKISKQLAKDTYSKIGSVSCPALGGEIIEFTSNGFEHLIRKGRKLRTKNEQRRRFDLVPYIEEIVKNPHAKITFRQTEKKYVVNRQGENIQLTSRASFWTFYTQINTSKIKVVIRQIHPGQKQFQSVMGSISKK